MQLVGRILWWNDRDGFGVIEDAQANEYYFDSSALLSRNLKSVKRNQFVTFHLNLEIKDCQAAAKVKIATASDRKRIESRFEKQLQLSLFA